MSRKRNCAIFLIMISCALSSVKIWAGEIETLFSKGNEYYQNGDYKAAIVEYEKIASLGYENWELYYNLGNANFKENQLARAILNFERAKKIQPKNEDINYNLEFANLRTADRIEQLPQFFLFDWLSNISYLLSLKTVGMIFLALYLILVALLIIRFNLKSGGVRRSVAVSIAGVGVFLIFSLSIFSMRVIENETKVEAIVLDIKIDVRSAPDEVGTEVFTLHKGVKVEVQDQSLEWAKIRLADGKVGWLKKASIEAI